MSKLWKMPLAVLAALAALVLASGTANAAEDPVSTVVECVVGLVSGGCPPPAAPPVTGGTTDAGSGSGSGAPAPVPVPVPGDVVGGVLGTVPAPTDEHTAPAAGTSSDQPADETDGGSAGGLLGTACDALPEIPAIPGLGSLTDLTCEQLPAVVCPPLLSHPEVPGLAEVAELLLCAGPSTASPPPPAGGEPSYENCDAARAAGAAPINAGRPGYRAGLDRDGDGVACEDSEDTGTAVVPVSASTPPVAVVGGPGRLAYTGLELSPQLGSAAALLTLGSGLLLAARRRS
jgi:hypothetical protein